MADRHHLPAVTVSGRPESWREVREFLSEELELNDEWQAAATVRLFRTGQWLYGRREAGVANGLAWRFWVLAERIWFHTFLGADIPAAMSIGRGVRFAHGGRGVVFHPRVRLGARCTVYHSVTAGLRGTSDDVPVIGDDVVLGVGCVVLGGVRVGDGAAVGPNAVIVGDVPERRHVTAAPATLREGEVGQDPVRATAAGRLLRRSADDGAPGPS